MLAILLVILSIFTAYFIYETRQPKTSTTNTSNKNKERDNSNDFYDDVDNVDENYVQVEHEQSTYTALNRSGREETDDHKYHHLYDVLDDYVNQKETVF